MTTQQAQNRANEQLSPLQTWAFKRLLVAVDDSEQSHFAVDAAIGLARQLNAEIVLINVFSAEGVAKPQVAFVVSDIRKGCIEAGDELLTRIKDKIRDYQLHVEPVLREGDAATEILNASIIYDTDLIVMGTHARGRIARCVLGSVARAVSQRATCPVLTVAHAPEFKRN